MLLSVHNSLPGYTLHWRLLVAYLSKLTVPEVLPDFLDVSTVANKGAAYTKKL